MSFLLEMLIQRPSWHFWLTFPVELFYLLSQVGVMKQANLKAATAMGPCGNQQLRRHYMHRKTRVKFNLQHN